MLRRYRRYAVHDIKSCLPPYLSLCLYLFLLGVGLPVSRANAADSGCEEEKETLGLSLTPQGQRAAKASPGLVITEILPLSQGAQLGLQKGDVIEQINSWRAQDCESYRQAVRDARSDQKAVLLLISRKGRQQAIAFAPELWVKQEEEKQEKIAVATLQSMLAAPLPGELQQKVGSIGDQALGILRALEAVAVVPGTPDAYEQAVEKARTQLAELDRASQGEAEKRVVAGAKTLFGYYLTAHDIRQYKKEFVNENRRDLRKARAAAYTVEDMPYFLKSPVPGWIDRYPFLRSSVSETPAMVSMMEQPGRWDPDKAVTLLWTQAKQETATFAQWLQGK